jgi:hypothetical protein
MKVDEEAKAKMDRLVTKMATRMHENRTPGAKRPIDHLNTNRRARTTPERAGELSKTVKERVRTVEAVDSSEL